MFHGVGVIQNIICLNGKNLFVSIANKGIFEFDERTLNSIKVVPLASSDLVTDSYIDSYDKVWFEINQSSLAYYDPFNRLTKRLILPVGKVNKSIKIQDGKELGMFILTASGDQLCFSRSSQTLSRFKRTTGIKPKW